MLVVREVDMLECIPGQNMKTGMEEDALRDSTNGFYDLWFPALSSIL